ncbi:hypothetical protein K458DRAFT_87165 [Lentithecium fluviatile CBS 122367]|uniref:Uncharacterized protein n=1 Tax=Lentithecium fluviatile CBS 122367 TaxID=1168545 RepID=A0A6G1IRJ9_9PLEO|nr:hypothetical protein K458DRAFT_87165 [Lentithecium fluviatile CBS 122367]
MTDQEPHPIPAAPPNSSPLGNDHVSPAEAQSSDSTDNVVQHYASSSASFCGVLEEILADMRQFKNVHTWDQKLIINPVKDMTLKVRRYLEGKKAGRNYLLAYSEVEEVATQNGITHVYPAMAHPGDIERHLFFKDGEMGHSKLLSRINAPTQTLEEPQMLQKSLRGRIIYLDQNVSSLHRAMLLFVFASCTRLQDEEEGYIRKFMERHLSIRNQIRIPQQWYETSGPQIDNSRQKLYRRATLSCHITYLTLSPQDASEETRDLIDRTAVFSFHHPTKTPSPTELYLFKATSSTLLTVCIPEESPTKQEEVNLLHSLQGFWTVLVVNCIPGFASAHTEHLTPVAQYIRGLTSSLVTLRMSTQSILDALRVKLDACEGRDLFDDENFTKSTLYHWTVRTCEELRNTNSSTIRFVRRLIPTHVRKVAGMANASESSGIAFWTDQLEEELSNLEDLQDQVSALKTQVQESRNALHGVTALLEARTALQQGERIKNLSYLATLYLPLTATASIYSMSVLPSSTTLYSFFIVLIGLLILTTTAAIYHPVLRNDILPHLFSLLDHSRKALVSASGRAGISGYLNSYIHLIKGSRDTLGARAVSKAWDAAGCLSMCILILPILVRVVPEIIISACVEEIKFPRDQYIMAQYIGNRYVNYQWHPLAFVRDAIRLLLLPVWVALAAGLMPYIMAVDVLYLVLSLPFKCVCCFISKV